MSFPVNFIMQTLNAAKASGVDFTQNLEAKKAEDAGQRSYFGFGRGGQGQGGHNHEDTDCKTGSCAKCAAQQ